MHFRSASRWVPSNDRDAIELLSRRSHAVFHVGRSNDDCGKLLILMSKRQTPIAVDLFSGCGGLTLGLKRGGFRVVGAVEIDRNAVRTYVANHAEVAVWESDIRDLQPAEVLGRLKLRVGELDLLAGCPPCQGYSRLRTLNGSRTVDDPRNDLLREFQRFVEETRPASVMMENVPALKGDRRFAEFRRALKSIGYHGTHRILNAADYGVPQRRARLIYLASIGVAIPFAKKTEPMKTVRDALGGLPRAGKSGDHAHDRAERRSDRVMQVIKHIPKDGGSRADLPEDLQLTCHKQCNGFGDVYGRMAWNTVAPTITSGCFNPSKGRFLHPEEDRAITMREASLLQGFPLDYRFAPETGKESLADMIGNALPPPFVEAHCRQIRHVIEMPDNLTPQQRSYCMSRIRGKDTRLEVRVRSTLHRNGLRFRKHMSGLPGRPDIVFTKARIAVFIDGDFWHGYQFPTWEDKMSDFWKKKISRTQERDVETNRRLRELGWDVLRFWQHEIEDDFDGCITRVMLILKERT